MNRGGGVLLSAAEVKAIDAAAVGRGTVIGALMAQAGTALADIVAAKARGVNEAGARVAVLAGAGMNGGDAMIAAADLKRRGLKTAIFTTDDPADLHGDVRAAAQNAAKTGCAITPVTPGAVADILRADIIVDGLYGIGLSRPVTGLIADMIAAVNERSSALVIAVDIPSGVDADTGKAWGAAVSADYTVTFVAPKRGLYLADGAHLCGDVIVADILEGGAGAYIDIGPEAPRALSAPPPGRFDKPLRAHKYQSGHAIACVGGRGATGAARLAARAALRVGAGVVTLACPDDALDECAAHATCELIAETPDVDALDALLSDDRVTGVLIGPGHGRTIHAVARTLAFAAAVLDTGRLTVLDADALTVWADGPDALFDRIGDAPAVMTPHMGEFAALFPDLAVALDDEPATSKIDVAAEAAARSGAVVVLKGVDTVVAAPDGRVRVHAAVGRRAAPWLATAGSGDVLAGLILGLGARGWPPFAAACEAVWLHVGLARHVGPGMIASDLVEAIAPVLKTLSPPAVR